MYVTIEWTRVTLYLFPVGSKPLVTSTYEMGRGRVGKCGGCAFRSAPLEEGKVGLFTLRLCKYVTVFVRSPINLRWWKRQFILLHTDAHA